MLCLGIDVLLYVELYLIHDIFNAKSIVVWKQIRYFKTVWEKYIYKVCTIIMLYESFSKILIFTVFQVVFILLKT